jgi:hypothetical protein
MKSPFFPGYTVSSCTLKTTHLIEAFADALACARPEDPILKEVDEWDPEDESDENMEDADEILESLFDALDSLAPGGCYFGAHEGDSACFGFWEIENA